MGVLKGLEVPHGQIEWENWKIRMEGKEKKKHQKGGRKPSNKGDLFAHEWAVIADGQKKQKKAPRSQTIQKGQNVIAKQNRGSPCVYSRKNLHHLYPHPPSELERRTWSALYVGWNKTFFDSL